MNWFADQCRLNFAVAYRSRPFGSAPPSSAARPLRPLAPPPNQTSHVQSAATEEDGLFLKILALDELASAI